MKKTFLICLVLALAIAVMSSCNVSPHQNDTPTEDLEFHLLDDGTYGVSAGDAKDFEKIVIPATYNDKAVTKIMDKAFFQAGNIKSITVPDSVTSIGEYAFSECSSLTDLTIGNGVTFIGSGAFNNSHRLKTTKYDNAYYIGNKTNPYVVLVTAPVSTPENPIDSCVIHNDTKVIGFGAFARNSDLKSINIPGGVKCISSSAFYGCSSLTSVTIPDSVTSIGRSAFFECDKLTSVKIGSGVTVINEFTFCACDKLETVELPGGITSIGDSAFADCPNLKQIKFCGTEAEWESVSKHSIWDVNSEQYTVVCNEK